MYLTKKHIADEKRAARGREAPSHSMPNSGSQSGLSISTPIAKMKRMAGICGVSNQPVTLWKSNPGTRDGNCVT